MIRRRRRPDELAGVREAPREPGVEAPPSPDDEVRELQRSAGNRAVSRLLQRQDAPTAAAPFSPLAPRGPFDLRPGAITLPELAPDVREKVRAFLETRKVGIGIRVAEGSISMPEVVRMVREGVPEAADADPFAIRMEVASVMGRETPPPTRAKRTAAGTESEIGARIANALGSAGKGLKVESRAGSLALTFSGVVASTKVGGATVTATGGPGGGEVTAGGGSASVTASASEKSVGLSAKLDRASFEAKVERDDSGTWSRWQVGLRVAVVGGDPLEDAADIPELREAAVKAEAAVRAVIAHLQAGGSPTDPKVKDLMKDVKPAVEGVKRAVQTPKGPNVTVAATVKGGDEKLGTFAGVSLIIEF
ncbi:MAG: hypothetical protein AB1416_11590 [Actinomycetota bacterium]